MAVRASASKQRTGGRPTFDSLECAVHALAPSYARCGVRITGQGLENAGNVFCCACAHCAEARGVHGFAARIG